MGMISLRDKRGAEEERTVNWVIALIILVLAVIAVWWAYTTFKGGTFPWQKSSISTTVQACAAACTGSDTYGYCRDVKTTQLTVDDYKRFGGNFTEKDNKTHTVKATCQGLADKDMNISWGVSSCDNLEC